MIFNAVDRQQTVSLLFAFLSDAREQKTLNLGIDIRLVILRMPGQVVIQFGIYFGHFVLIFSDTVNGIATNQQGFYQSLWLGRFSGLDGL